MREMKSNWYDENKKKSKVFAKSVGDVMLDRLKEGKCQYCGAELHLFPSDSPYDCNGCHKTWLKSIGKQ